VLPSASFQLLSFVQGLALENRSAQIDGVLGALLAKLEKDKPAINAGPDDHQHCENFAVKVFNRADRVDRAGRADKGTATTYYAASVFLEVCMQGSTALYQSRHSMGVPRWHSLPYRETQLLKMHSIWARNGTFQSISMIVPFLRVPVVDTWGCGAQILRQWGELSPDLVDMQKYAAWKATDIRKALREGRAPTAGPAADSADAKAEADLQAEADLLDDLGLPAVPGRAFYLS